MELFNIGNGVVGGVIIVRIFYCNFLVMFIVIFIVIMFMFMSICDGVSCEDWRELIYSVGMLELLSSGGGVVEV